MFVILAFWSSKLFALLPQQEIISSPQDLDQSPSPKMIPVQEISEINSQKSAYNFCEQPSFVQNPSALAQFDEICVGAQTEFFGDALLDAEKYPVLSKCDFERTKSQQPKSTVSEDTISYYVKLAEENIAEANELNKRNIFFAVIALLRKSPFFSSPLFYLRNSCQGKSTFPVLVPEPILSKLPIDTQISFYFLAAKALNGMREFKNTVDLITNSFLFDSSRNELKIFDNEFEYDPTGTPKREFFKSQSEILRLQIEFNLAREKLLEEQTATPESISITPPRLSNTLKITNVLSPNSDAPLSPFSQKRFPNRNSITPERPGIDFNRNNSELSLSRLALSSKISSNDNDSENEQPFFQFISPHLEN